MSTTSLTGSYRPLRVGFVCDVGDLDGLTEISCLNSLLWGGIFNPVIPADGDKQSIDQLIRLFHVDVLVPVENLSPSGMEIIRAYPFLRTSDLPHNEILTPSWQSDKLVVALLDVLHIVDHFWEKEMRHKPSGFKSEFALINWQEQDPCARVFSLSFGRYPQDKNLFEDYGRAFQDGLKARTVLIGAGDKLGSKIDAYIPPLALTSHRLHGTSSALDDPGIYVGMEDNFNDLINFWNLRAAGIQLRFVPANHIDRFHGRTQAYIRELEAKPAGFSEGEQLIGVYHRKGAYDFAKVAAEALDNLKKMVFCEVDSCRWNGLNTVPQRFTFERKRILGNVDKRFGKYSVSFALPAKPVSEDLDLNEDLQRIVLVVSPSGELEYPSHTLAPPAVHALNEFASRVMAVDPWKLRIEPTGIALIHQLYDSADWLYPIGNKEIILKLFDVSGVSATTNPAGLLAEKIIASMREEDPLEACRVFKIRGVRKLLKDTPTDTRITWNAAIATIGKESFTKFKKLYIESRRTPELKPADAFAFLVKKNVFSPRLIWWRRLLRARREFACPVCGLKSTISAQKFEGLWRCEYCREEQDLRPLVVSQLQRNGKEWTFRRAGFFSKENNQEGAIPVILTLLQFKRRFHSTNFMHSTALSLTIADQSKCELDLVVMHQGRGGRLEIGIAECKDQGGRIDSNDVQNLRSVAQQLSRTGVSPYLIFSKTADSFSPEEMELFRGLVKDRVFPILFTNKELEPYQPYEEYGQSQLPAPYASTLGDMARNTLVIYLK